MSGDITDVFSDTGKDCAVSLFVQPYVIKY
jgi:hypothetical protein